MWQVLTSGGTGLGVGMLASSAVIAAIDEFLLVRILAGTGESLVIAKSNNCSNAERCCLAMTEGDSVSTEEAWFAVGLFIVRERVCKTTFLLFFVRVWFFIKRNNVRVFVKKMGTNK